jgi:hypothetical protein
LPTYADALWIRGELGWPVADAVCDAAGNCSQQFQGGAIGVKAGATSGFLTRDSFADAYLAAGGASSSWGAPVGVVKSFETVNGPGRQQNFTGGQALSSAAGTFFVPTKFLPTYADALWIRGELGWPVADAVCDAAGNCSQQFQGGTIVIAEGIDSGSVILN